MVKSKELPGPSSQDQAIRSTESTLVVPLHELRCGQWAIQDTPLYSGKACYGELVNLIECSVLLLSRTASLSEHGQCMPLG